MDRIFALLLVLFAAVACDSGEPLRVEPLGVYDVDPASPVPKFVAAFAVENPGAEPVTITQPPILRVRSVHVGGDLPVQADLLTGSGAPEVRIEPGQRKEIVYDLWRLANLQGQGIFPELRTAPGDLRFRLEIETDAGAVATSEWAGVGTAEEADALLRRIEGKDSL